MDSKVRLAMLLCFYHLINVVDVTCPRGLYIKVCSTKVSTKGTFLPSYSFIHVCLFLSLIQRERNDVGPYEYLIDIIVK